MRLARIGFVFLVMAARGWAAGDWIEQGDSLDREFKSAQALEFYLKAEDVQPDDPELLRKISKQYVEMVIDAPTRAEKTRLAEVGYAYALKAKKLAPKDAQVRLTVSIAAGRLAFFRDARGKLELSRVVESDAAAAAKLDPRYALAWHVLGRWHYEIASLNLLLKALAEVVYGKIPSASYEQAIFYLEKAAQLEPGNALFHAELGRAYLTVDRREDARRELQKSLTLPQRNRDDADAQSRAKLALQGL
ncbi:MAG: tetratricopeptide repeat protein [Chthoniobacterales bacterium]|jgi:tetratricopeptide (TPR) repeat protein